MASAFPSAPTTQRFRAGGIIRHSGTVKPQGIEEIRFVSEPDDPGIDQAVEWYSNGTGFGDPGDKITKINVAGTIKTFTWPDFSAIVDEQGSDWLPADWDVSDWKTI